MGTECPALFCNHQETATALMRAGEALHDPIWQLPLFESYDRFLDTGQAGLSSTGSGGGYGGAITAALFLRRFTGRDVNWAHVDVMAWNISSRAGRPKGGEAMGLRATFQHISELAETNS
jgi:leucyl aminopeptidase